MSKPKRKTPQRQRREEDVQWWVKAGPWVDAVTRVAIEIADRYLSRS